MDLVSACPQCNLVTAEIQCDLVVACVQNNCMKVQELITQGTDVNITHQFYYFVPGISLLHYAISQGHFDIVRVLVEAGADVNQFNHYWETPLTSAVRTNNLEIVRYLLSKNCDVDARVNIFFWTALHRAVKENNIDIVRELLHYKANPNTTDHYGRTPICDTSNIEIVKELLKANADVNIVSDHGWTPLHFANDATITEELLKYGANPSIQNWDHNTALHLASKYGDRAKVQVLIQYVDPTIKNRDGRTALDLARTGEIRNLILDSLIDIKDPEPY